MCMGERWVQVCMGEWWLNFGARMRGSRKQTLCAHRLEFVAFEVREHDRHVDGEADAVLRAFHGPHRQHVALDE